MGSAEVTSAPMRLWTEALSFLCPPLVAVRASPRPPTRVEDGMGLASTERPDRCMPPTVSPGRCKGESETTLDAGPREARGRLPGNVGTVWCKTPWCEHARLAGLWMGRLVRASPDPRRDSFDEDEEACMVMPESCSGVVCCITPDDSLESITCGGVCHAELAIVVVEL